MKAAEFIRVILILSLGLACSPAWCASSGNPVELTYFPEHCTQVGHVDLAQARNFPWFVALKTKFVPVQFYRFENFISSPQLGLGNQIKSLYWADVAPNANSPGGVLGIADGEFDRQTAVSALETLKSPSYDYGGYTFYETASDFSDADLWFTFLDSDTIVFGSRLLLEQSIRSKTAAEPSLPQNSKLMELIRRQANDRIFWSVSTGDAARAAWRRLLPAAGTVPAADQAVASIVSLEISAEGDSDTELDLSAVAATNTPENALAFSALLQAGLALKQFEVGQMNSDVARILRGFSLSANANRVAISIPLKNDDVATLVQHDDLLVPAR
jgi:hypothetical protein